MSENLLIPSEALYEKVRNESLNAVRPPSAPPPLKQPAMNTPIYSPQHSKAFTKATQPPLYLTSTIENTLSCDAAISVLNYGGYRISEVLSITWNDILPGDRVLVRAAKKGRASIAHLSGISSACLNIPPSNRALSIFRCSYSQVYRRMLRLGYAMQPQGHVNRSVTHTPRRNMAVAAASLFSREISADLLHHVSKTAIDYYVQPVKPRPAILIYPPNGALKVKDGPANPPFQWEPSIPPSPAGYYIEQSPFPDFHMLYHLSFTYECSHWIWPMIPASIVYWRVLWTYEHGIPVNPSEAFWYQVYYW